MRNKLILSVIIILCILAGVGNAYAAAASPTIRENPDLIIVMDGEITPYKDVPISVGQWTLLPLRELLVNLGVPDDEEHIVWDGQEKSVTVYKEDTKLYLKQGSRTAYVNEAPVQLDVAPVSYAGNQRFYIPLRFVSNTLGKKVVWDSPSNSVFIKDKLEYDKLKGILDRSQAAMEDIKKCKLIMDVDVNYKMGQVAMDTNIDIADELDLDKKAMHTFMKMKLLGMEINTDTYYSDNASYTLNPFSGKWEKKTFTAAEYNEEFDNQDFLNLLTNTETLCAGLMAADTEDSTETVLKGDVYLNALMNKAMTAGANQGMETGREMSIDKINLKLIIDNQTHLLKSMEMNIDGTQTNNDTQSSYTTNLKVEYGDYNGSFEIAVPEKVRKEAVEETDPF